MNVLVLIVRYIMQSKLWLKTFDIIPVRLNALRISERWCDCGMDKRSISQPRQARDKQFETIGQWQFHTHQAECVALIFNFLFKTLRGFHFEHNHATMRCSRARATTPSLSLHNVIHACAAAFFSFSLALALALRTRASSYLLCASSSPAGRARSHPTFSA